MISIRLAEPSDLPQILAVLKAALGDPHGRRNVHHWNWKHHENPFGRSAVMLAFNQDELVGVRAMMQWEFCLGGKIIRAWRATDTATAPGQQRSGIFSQLTGSMVEHLSGMGDGIIFNTPNPISAQGYFKLGWVPAGQTATLVRPEWISLLLNRFTNADSKDQLPLRLPSHDQLENYHQIFKDQLITNWKADRLEWRYRMVPDLNYSSFCTPEGTIIFRMNRRGSLKELRILELFPSTFESRMDIKLLIKDQRPDIVTVLQDGQGIIRKYLPAGFIDLTSHSPKVVCRQLSGPEPVTDFRNSKSRYFSGGTLELF